MPMYCYGKYLERVLIGFYINIPPKSFLTNVPTTQGEATFQIPSKSIYIFIMLYDKKLQVSE